MFDYTMIIFFFQAEDGIRDIGVTGVQTCALPISPWRSPSPSAVPPDRRNPSGAPEPGPPAPTRGCPEEIPGWGIRLAGSTRSEERRVGKGVDLGGRRIIKKKKHNINKPMLFLNET